MRQLSAFIRKECMEVSRTGKLLILLILFVLFGIMNPAMAKLTPWIMEITAESLEGTGLLVTHVEVDAMTSWTQFYKNIPIALIVYILMFCGVMTTEYQRGTLVNVVTKGLSRWKILFSKYAVLVALWTICYYLCYAITYFYNCYFWDNSIAVHCGFASFCYWLFGVWIISLMFMMSAFFSGSSSVLLMTGGGFLIFYIGSMFGNIASYLPTELGNGMQQLTGGTLPGDYLYAIVITVFLIVAQMAVATVAFNKKTI